MAEDRIGRLKAPAGLDIGAVTPEEIAVSILAEIVQFRRARKSITEDDDVRAARTGELGGRVPSPMRESKDPVCGMLVDVATARHQVEAWGRVIYFCCAGCKATFERDPGQYAAAAATS